MNYIKKMIQLQFDLPGISEKDIMEFMAEELKIEDQLKVYFEMITKGLESNQREIKRFLNSLNLMRMLGDSIQIKGYEEELLIKWSVLNFSSKKFIKEVNKNHELIIQMQEISGKETTEDIEEFIGTLDEISKNLCNIFKLDEKIINVLEYGDKRFTDNNISSYIFLSSVAPKEPGEKGIKIEPGANLRDADLRNVDFSGAELSNANLIGADLNEANLRNVDLNAADLRDADLRDVDFSGADLRDADLSGAELCFSILSGADLSRADLSGADLSSAILRGTNLSRADLSGADLSRANLSSAIFSEAILSEAKFFEAKFDEECLKTIRESINWPYAEFDLDVIKTLQDMRGS